MQNSEFYNCTIEEVREIAPGVKSFFIRYPFHVEFKGGQFVIIEFGSLEHQFSTRSYSIADMSHGNTIELCVVLKEEGAATPILFNQSTGDELQVSLPQGRFILPEEIDNNKTIGFVCTGTGVAPFRAMIKELLFERRLSNPVHLFFGCRKKEDILYKDEFENLSRQFPNFHYYPTLSREEWSGRSGYVHEHYPEIFIHKPEALIYICGWTNMIKQTRDTLKSYGYGRTEIKVEFYD